MILVENKPALLVTKSEDLLVKSGDATTVETQVSAVYRIKHSKIFFRKLCRQIRRRPNVCAL